MSRFRIVIQRIEDDGPTERVTELDQIDVPAPDARFLQKETALISVLGPLEATRQAQIYASLNFNFTSYLAAGLIFLVVTIPLARFTDYLLAREEERRSIGGAV